MPRVLSLQTNFNSGMLDPRLAARTDIKHYYQGAASAINVVSTPQGGLKRRPGFAYVDDIGESARLAAFAFNVEQTYLMVFTNNNIEVFKDGVSQANVTTTYTSAQLFELQWTQSADTMIIVHEDHAPAKLVRGGSHTSWTLSTITLSNIPQFDYGSGAVDVWSSAKGWPKSVTFHEGRMWFGGSKSRPQTMWGSKVSDFYNFAIGTGLDDELVDITLDTDQVNAITAIFPGRHLQVFTTGGEFMMPDSPITPAKSAVKRQTLYGSSTIPPKSIDGATIFMDRTGKSLREFLFTYTEDAYTAGTTSIVASNLLNSPVDMDVLRGTTTDDSNYVYIVNADGTMAVFNTLRNQEVSGWTKWTTAGTVESVCTVVDEVYLLVKRTINSATKYYLESLNVNTFMDANKYQTITPSATITGLAHLNDEECRVVADDAVMPNATPSSGSITLSRTATTVEVGLDYDIEIKTMPINQDFQDGPTLVRKKRIVKVVADVYESLGLFVNGERLPDRQFGTGILGTTPTVYTGIHEVYLLGWDRLSQVTITQEDPLPMTILGLAVEFEA